MRSSTKPSSHAGSVSAVTRSARASGSGSSPSCARSRSSGVPAAHACGRAERRHDARRLVRPPLAAGEELRQPVLEERRAVEERAHDELRLRTPTGLRETERDQRVVVRPDGAVVVLERVERALVGGERADPPAGPERSRDELRGNLRDAVGGNDAAPQQMAHVRRERVDRPLVGVEAERVPAALRQPERGVEPLAQRRRFALRDAPPSPRRATRAGRALPCAASRRRRSPAPRPVRSARARASRRGRPSSCRSPSSSGCRCRGSRGAGTRRSRRRRDRRTSRSSRARGAPPAPARARSRRRRSSATAPRAGRGTAASRRPCRSSGRSRSARSCRAAARARSSRARRRAPDRPYPPAPRRARATRRRPPRDRAAAPGTR